MLYIYLMQAVKLNFDNFCRHTSVYLRHDPLKERHWRPAPQPPPSYFRGGSRIN